MVQDPVNVVVTLIGILLWPEMTLAIILLIMGHWVLAVLSFILAIGRVDQTKTVEKVVEKVRIVEKIVFRGGRMSRADAYSTLGIPQDAPREAVLAAYRTMMSRVHPDRGGSNYLAAKVNEAKQLLLE